VRKPRHPVPEKGEKPCVEKHGRESFQREKKKAATNVKKDDAREKGERKQKQSRFHKEKGWCRTKEGPFSVSGKKGVVPESDEEKGKKQKEGLIKKPLCCRIGGGGKRIGPCQKRTDGPRKREITDEQSSIEERRGCQVQGKSKSMTKKDLGVGQRKWGEQLDRKKKNRPQEGVTRYLTKKRNMSSPGSKKKGAGKKNRVTKKKIVRKKTEQEDLEKSRGEKKHKTSP